MRARFAVGLWELDIQISLAFALAQESEVSEKANGLLIEEQG